MDLSFSELKDLVFNASLGSNLPAGTGEDLSLAVTFLESRSLPGCKEFLSSLRCKRHPTVPPQSENSSLVFSNARAIFEGVSAIDLLVSEVCESVILKNCDSQTLMLGLASNYRGTSFCFYKNNEMYAGISDDELILRNQNFKCTNDIEICLTQGLSDTPSTKCTRMALNKNTFEALIELASKMLVPESELSREKGAGAGNIDND